MNRAIVARLAANGLFGREHTRVLGVSRSPIGRTAGRSGFKVTDGDDDLLTVKDLADLLKVCTATVYKMVDRLHIPHIRVLNSIQFRRGDVKMFVEGLGR